MANSRSDRIVPVLTTSLTQIYGENLHKNFLLKGPKVLIGRNLKADIKLDCPNVSRKHCILTMSDDGWIIEDNNSQNGTYINGLQLKAGESSLLQCGDIIFLGPPSEMPQAFCVEVAYKSLEETAMEFESQSVEEPQTVEEEVISDLRRSKKEMFSSRCPHKEKPEIQEEMVVSSDLSKKKHDTCPKKAKGLKNSKLADEDAAVITEKELKENTETDSSAATSSVLRHKRKAPSVNHQPLVFLSIKSLPKKTKLTVDFEPDKSVDNSQVNEISSTEADQVEDSLSLLDIKNLAESSTDDFNKPSCSHNVPSLEEKDENDRLKSQLASVAEELKKFKKEKEQILKDMSKKNKTLAEQLAEKEKLKEEQEQLKEELLNCELKAKNEIKKELLEKFSEDLVCIICSELLIKPCVLDCAHTFCEYCIKLWKKNKNECPMCRKRIETVTRVLTLDNFIDKTLQTLTPEQREVREKLIKERQESENKQKAPAKQRKFGRRRRNQTARNHNNANRPRDSVEIIGESNMVFPYPSIPSISTAPYLQYPVIRLRDALNFYLA